MSHARRLVEIVSRGRSFQRRLPEEFGGRPIVVSPDARLSVLRRGPEAFDSALLQAVARLVRPQDVIWDVGANLGVFSLAALGRGAKSAVAIEADAWLVSLLRRTLALPENAGLSISIVPCAAADKPGIAEFVIASRGRASNHLAEVGGSTQAGGRRDTVLAPTLPLDVLLDRFEPPTLVKIDVEGADELVLKGMTKVLETHKPKIYCETFERIRTSSLLERFGYVPTGADDGSNLTFVHQATQDTVLL